MDKTHKREMRVRMRQVRRDHVENLDQMTRALFFRRPPMAVIRSIAAVARIGLYRATPYEAPAGRYAQYFMEAGHTIALPRFTHKGSLMKFAVHTDPFEESDLTVGPFGVLQPGANVATLVPDVLFVPLLAFTAEGVRLGQGGGHYDRWLNKHHDTRNIGLAWDCQSGRPSAGRVP